MSGIFISYRREDSRADAGRLTKDLHDYLEDGQTFRDIDTVEPGVDFVKAINSAVSSCNVLIAIIGPNWLTIKNQTGGRRLDDPDDYVRLEIDAALSRDIRLIPVLVGGAMMPQKSDLPESLSALAHRQAHELSESRWNFDVEQLAELLKKIPGIKARKATHANTGKTEVTTGNAQVKRFGRFAGAAVLSFMGVLFLLAGLIEGQGLAFIWAVVFLGGGYWLYSKR